MPSCHILLLPPLSPNKAWAFVSIRAQFVIDRNGRVARRVMHYGKVPLDELERLLGPPVALRAA